MRRRKLLLLLPLILLLILVMGFVTWSLTGPAAAPEAQTALLSDAFVEVDQDDWIVFRPASGNPTTGLIFYPGGRVDPVAYAPLGRAIAAEGYLVVIAPMPLRLAVLAPERANDVIEAYPEISTWAIGGHSLGGAMAANYAANNPEIVQGLALWAAYPTQAGDLSDYELAVTSIYGTRDGVASPDEIRDSGALLPPETVWVTIDGGNHAQFGWYGAQSGDNQADISREEQQKQVVRATLEMLDIISGE